MKPFAVGFESTLDPGLGQTELLHRVPVLLVFPAALNVQELLHSPFGFRIQFPSQAAVNGSHRLQRLPAQDLKGKVDEPLRADLLPCRQDSLASQFQEFQDPDPDLVEIDVIAIGRRLQRDQTAQ